MGTVIQDKPQSNPERQPRWDRFERADLFEQYRELQAQGVSQRQAAKSFRFPEPPCKPGAYGTTPSISVLMWPSSFKVAPDLPFYTAW